MAQVDFSNAVLDVNPNSIYYPMNGYGNSIEAYLLLADQIAFYATGTSTTSIVTNLTRQKLSDTPQKVSLLYSGTFTASGTEFYFGGVPSTSYEKPWKVSNISFNANDSFDFVIDIDIEVV